MTALEPGQHDEFCRQAFPCAAYEDRRHRGVDYCWGCHRSCDCSRIARVVERERGKALAEAADAIDEWFGPCEGGLDGELFGGKDQGEYLTRSIAHSLIVAAARPAEGTPDA